MNKTPHETRQSRFYQHTALLDETGQFYGWVNKQKAQGIILWHEKEITIERFEGRRAIRSALRFHPDPFKLKDICIVTGSRHYTMHHVLPSSGFYVLNERFPIRAFYFYVLLTPELHEAVESQTVPLYAEELNRLCIQQRCPELTRLRVQIGLSKHKNRNGLRYIQPENLVQALAQAGWSSVEDIPNITGKEDPLVLQMKSRRTELEQREQKQIEAAHLQFWTDFADRHSFGEIVRMFTRPILEMQPKFLDPRVRAYWEEAGRR